MRRTASKVIRDLELRVASLEKQARTEEFYVEILRRKIRSLRTERILELRELWERVWGNTIGVDEDEHNDAIEALDLIKEELRRRYSH